jgi:hypothetical protein
MDENDMLKTWFPNIWNFFCRGAFSFPRLEYGASDPAVGRRVYARQNNNE